MMVDENGIFEGERINRCSVMAQLYYQRLTLGANGFGRIRIDYSILVARCFPLWRPEQLPSEADLFTYITEYHRNRLLFIYRVDGQLWGQFDVKKGTYGKYQTKADLRSPAPPADEWSKWVEENRRHSSKKATVAGPPSSTGELFSSIAEKFPHGVGVGGGDGCNGVGVGVDINSARARGQNHQPTQPPNQPPIVMPASSLGPPPDSDLTITAIAQAHPRLEKPVETERAIVAALEGGVADNGRPVAGLISRYGDAKKAMQFLLDRAQLYKQCTDAWPPGERDFIVGSPRWFAGGCYDEREEDWRRRINGNRNETGKQERRVERSAGNFAEAITRIVASGDIPGRGGDQRLPVGNAAVGDRGVAAPVIVLPNRNSQAGD